MIEHACHKGCGKRITLHDLPKLSGHEDMQVTLGITGAAWAFLWLSKDQAEPIVMCDECMIGALPHLGKLLYDAKRKPGSLTPDKIGAVLAPRATPTESKPSLLARLTGGAKALPPKK